MPGRPRWYFDADTIGLGKALRDVRRDVTWPGDTGERSRPRHKVPPCVIQSADVDDEIWIPRVTAAGLAIITRDVHIQTRTAELNAVISSRAKLFAITSAERLDLWGLLEVFVSSFRAIEAAADTETGPFVYAVTRSGVRRLDVV